MLHTLGPVMIGVAVRITKLADLRLRQAAALKKWLLFRAPCPSSMMTREKSCKIIDLDVIIVGSFLAIVKPEPSRRGFSKYIDASEVRTWTVCVMIRHNDAGRNTYRVAN